MRRVVTKRADWGGGGSARCVLSRLLTVAKLGERALTVRYLTVPNRRRPNPRAWSPLAARVEAAAAARFAEFESSRGWRNRAGATFPVDGRTRAPITQGVGARVASFGRCYGGACDCGSGCARTYDSRLSIFSVGASHPRSCNAVAIARSVAESPTGTALGSQYQLTG